MPVVEADVKVIGLDASTKNIGVCVLSVDGPHILASGETALAGADVHARIHDAVARLGRLLTLYPEAQLVAIEQPFVGPSAKVSLELGAVFGALWCRADMADGRRVLAITPAEAKLAATGDGHADKRAVQRALQAQFGNWGPDRPLGEHQADAIAVALAAWGKIKAERLAEAGR